MLGFRSHFDSPYPIRRRGKSWEKWLIEWAWAHRRADSPARFEIPAVFRGRQRSEIAEADLRKVGENGDIYRLEYSKMQQAGVKSDSTPDKPILGRSAGALTAWLEAAGIREGAIFRRIWKDRVGPAPARSRWRRSSSDGPRWEAGGGRWGAQSAVGLCDRGWEARRTLAGGYGDDRTSFPSQCNWVLPVGPSRRQSGGRVGQITQRRWRLVPSVGRLNGGQLLCIFKIRNKINNLACNALCSTEY